MLVDGSDLHKVTRSPLASQLGVVFQDTFLFDASVADNLRYARPEATLQVARMASAESPIRSPANVRPDDAAPRR